MRANSPHTHLLILASILFAGQARGIILYGTDDPGANTTAPTGLYESAGWGWQGLFGSFLGTMIGPQHFITAQHIGNQGGTFLSSALFNGIADVAYQVIPQPTEGWVTGTLQARTCAFSRYRRLSAAMRRFMMERMNRG